jgi:acetyl-CoA carboxylase carboxyltransferase component
VTHEDVTKEDLGGAMTHNEKSGVAHFAVEDDAECLALIRELLSFMPGNNLDEPPRKATDDPDDREDDALDTLVPVSPNQPYDMLDLIHTIADDGYFLEVHQHYARNMIVGFARLGGRPVGIVANNPKQMGGILANDTADKAAHFIQICDAFGIPLVFLMDVPGFMVGSAVEHGGIIRHGAKMLHAMASATVAKLTVVVRKGYGAGYYVMAGRAYEPDLLVAWPGAEISVMGAEGMVGIAGRKLFGDKEPPPEVKQQLTQLIQSQIDITRVASWGLIDDVIDPRDTRHILCRAVEMSWDRKVERPYRKHGIMPV